MADKTTKRWTRSEADEHAVSSGCWFDERRADHCVEFFAEHLRHTKGRWDGKPFELLDWQRDDLIKPLFGWMNDDGDRRYRIAYIEVAKKNGKSSLCGGIGLYLLAADGEAGSQVYCAASDREQASIVYRECSAMAKSSPLLRDYIVPRDSTKNLAIPSQNAFLRAISAEHFTAEGLDAHGVIFDELHTQRTRDLWDALRYAGAARRQPLLVSITTAGYDRHSICYEQHEHARRVLEGTLHDDQFFAFIRAADQDDDWTKPATWKKANPSLGHILREKDLAADCKEAMESPAKENSFRRYRLCQWTEQAVRWLPMDKWDASAGEVDAAALEGRYCYAGLDLASTTDLSALVLLFPNDGDGYTLLPFFWAPEENARLRSRRDRVPYLEWARQGLLTLTPGNVTDYGYLRRDINALGDKYEIRELGIDRLFQGAQLGVELQNDGFAVTAVAMSYMALAAPSAELERLVLSGNLHHGAHPIMRWMAANVTVEQDCNGNIKPSKSKSTERIDGIMSTVIALALAITADEGGSAYDHHGVIVL